MGVLFQSNTPFMHSSADSLGLVRDSWGILRELMASGSNLHHRKSGNSGCKVDRPEIKWFLKLSMDFSAAFTLCMSSGTKSSSIFLVCRK